MLSGQVAFSFLNRGDPTLSITAVSVPPPVLSGAAAGAGAAGTAVATGAGAAGAGAAGAGAAGAASSALLHAIAANAITAANGSNHKNLPFLPIFLMVVPPESFCFDAVSRANRLEIVFANVGEQLDYCENDWSTSKRNPR